MKRLLSMIIGLILGLVVVAGRISPCAAALDYQEVYISPSGTHKVAIIVNSTIYESIEASLNQYVVDLEAEDYQVTITKIISGTAEELRDYFINFPDLEGVIMIGDSPVAWYEVEGLYGLLETFITDLFYMDLDGIWEDTDNNGKYDRHLGELHPEIWLGHLKASPLDHPTLDEVGLLNNYFSKNHAYRRGELSMQIRALGYIDDDWRTRPVELSRAYSDVTIINDPATTTAVDYKNRLRENYEWIEIWAHTASPDGRGHSFGLSGSVYYYDVQNTDPLALFYNVSSCYNGNYTYSNYMTGHYIFAETNGLAAFSATHHVSSLGRDAENFFSRLGLNYRENIGGAYKNYYGHIWLDPPGNKRVYYPQTLLGDPTLTLDPPIASIDSIEPVAVGKGVAVTFTGSGNIREGSIVGYSWRSSIDGVLNTESSFSTSSLSIGEHTIYFKVQDNKGRWSTEAESVLEVTAVAPCVQVDLDENDIINSSDVKILLNSWLSSGLGDFNFDSKVNSLDFAILTSLWGQVCIPSPTPTPSSTPTPTSSPSPTTTPAPSLSPTPSLVLSSTPTPTSSPGSCLKEGAYCNSSPECCKGLVCDPWDSRCRLIINDDQYFTISVGEEDFCMHTTRDETIKLAVDRFAGRNTYFPNGVLLNGHGGFNYGSSGPSKNWWSWHLDPEQVEMVFGSIELCDGRPSFVESERCYWLYTVGQYCPWGGQVTAIGCEGLSVTPPRCLGERDDCKGSIFPCCPELECQVCADKSSRCVNACGGYPNGGDPCDKCLRQGRCDRGLPCCPGFKCDPEYKWCGPEQGE